MILGGVACSADQAERAAPPRAPGDDSKHVERCENVRAQGLCRTGRTEAGALVRYALVGPSSGAATTDATVVDLGGPGVALFGLDWPGEALQLLADRYHSMVVVVEEPWVRTPYPSGCREAASAWFEALHSGAGDDGAGFADACRLGSGAWGWTPETYQEAVDGALSQEALRFHRFVGASFGAIRLTYLGQLPPEVMLVSPAPLAQSPSDYLRTRIASARDFCKGQRLPRSCTGPLRAAGKTDRALDVTDFDLGAAWVATNYQRSPRKYRRELAGAPDAEIVGALSDAVTGRFGVSDVSPSTFAYFDEVCTSFGAWRPDVGSDLAAASFMLAWHQACGRISGSKPDVDLAALRQPDVCLVSYRGDGVVPSAASVRWWGKVADRKALLPGMAHGVISPEVLDACGRA